SASPLFLPAPESTNSRSFYICHFGRREMLSVRRENHRMRNLIVAAIICLLTLIALSGTVFRATDAQEPGPADATPTPTPGTRYRQTNFVSDIPGFALIQDPLVVNPWGVTLSGSSPFWLANNGTSTSSLYRGDVGSIIFFKQPAFPITIPETPPSITGTVFNTGGATDFVVTSGSASAQANFIFAS